jgi:hypothetical protein
MNSLDDLVALYGTEGKSSTLTLANISPRQPDVSKVLCEYNTLPMF